MNKLNAFLAISLLGTITNLMTEAKSLFGALAALASLIASCYAIAIARKNLKKAQRDEPPQENCRNRGNEVLTSPLLGGPRFATANDDAGEQNCGGLGEPLGQGEGERKNCRNRGNEVLTFFLLFGFFFAAGCASEPNGKSPLARGLDHAALALTATTTNITAHEIIIANEVVGLDPLTRQLTTNIAYTTNVTLLTNITAIARPILSRTITTAESASGFLPPPYGEAVTAGFAGLSLLLGWAVRRRNALLKTVIQGVENSGNKEVKTHIAGKALESGVLPALHSLVKQLTK